MEETRYQGEKIYLRVMTDEDTEDILRWRNAEHVRTRFIFQERLTRQMHEHWIQSKVRRKEVYQFIICDRLTNEGYGSVYLRDVVAGKEAEYGIFLGEEKALGRGIGTEAARLILRFAFEELGLLRVYLRVLQENEAAIASYHKAGFAEIIGRTEEVILQDIPKKVIFMEFVRNSIK